MRLLATLLFAVLVAACSGATTPAETTPTQATPAAPAPNNATPTANGQANETTPAPGQQSVNPNDPLGFGNAANTAMVVIGDQTYTFENLYCVTLAGALGASSVGGDPTVDISLPPENWQSAGGEWEDPSVRVQSDEPYFDYQAGGSVDDRITPEMSQVTSFSSDGKHASGEANFIDEAKFMLDQSSPSVSGTFEVTCGS